MSSDALEVSRDWLLQGVDQVAADVGRVFKAYLPLRSEPGLGDPLGSAHQPEPELVARIERFAQLPEGSLGGPCSVTRGASASRSPDRTPARSITLRPSPVDHLFWEIDAVV